MLHQQYIRIQRMITISFAIVIATGIILFASSSLWLWKEFSSTGTIPSVDALVTRSDRIIAVRFPDTNNPYREQVIIVGNHPHMISRTIVLNDQDGIVTKLSPKQWADWNTLRLDWCVNPPALQGNTEPLFRIALRCPMDIDTLLNIRVIEIPAQDLPPSLRTLLTTVASPYCQDPLCGW